ncbi:hypothetical protein [Tsukamurella tyrosinosolvens]|uniref:Swt1-like HEPN domain-containing protein n=1 Tax=Tsukamurella tyrosinosolvens TaxID=57704 RepID=A0A1H5AS90_TSUTY|nr:hypothetical protein [Tsukamurella tyrosinosolvens]SED45289.1 hypothetical protein SAMN04489793_4996 [Tsukamurella tyrosinosolvens]
MTDTTSWFDGVARDARRYSIVFLHLGAAFASCRADLESTGAALVTVDDYLDGTSGCGEESLLIIDQIERCIENKKLRLGDLRSRVMTDVDENSKRIVLISSRARSAFPRTIGSDLLTNAKHCFIKSDSDQGTSPAENSISHPDWPAGDLEQLLIQCVNELSTGTVVDIGSLIWDLGLSPNETIENLTPVDVEALRSSGLIEVVDSGKPSWTISSRWKMFRSAVATAASTHATSSEWLSDAFVDLWFIERQVRNVFRTALIAKYANNWRSASVNGVSEEELVARAKRDAAPRAERVEDLRDPLEWLTTSELLDLREARSLGELGIEAFLWTKMRNEILPIRNRIAHMRIVSERDALTVSTWRKIVQKKLQ